MSDPHSLPQISADQIPEPDLSELTAADIRFCQRLMVGESQFDAFTAEYGPRDTDNATRVAASRLVTNRNIAIYLDRLRKVAADAAQITVEELAVLQLNFARADFRRIMTKTGEFLPLDQWPDEVAIAVESMETDELFARDPENSRRRILVGHTRKVKFVNKGSAAERLMKWKKMLGNEGGKPGGTDGQAGKAGPEKLEIDRGPAAVEPPKEEPKAS